MSLLVSLYDKISIKGIYSVYDDIFLNSLKLDREKDFSLDKVGPNSNSPLIITISNQLTT